jgi:hypothetical protein
MRAAAASLAAIGLALSLTACSTDDSVEDINAEYCAGQAKVQEEVDELQALIATDATTEELKAQRDFVLSAIQANSVPVSQLSQEVRDEVEAADAAFTEAVNAIPDSATPAEAAVSYAAAIDAWETAVGEVASETGCS